MDRTKQQTYILTEQDGRSQMVTRYGCMMFDLWYRRLKCPQQALDMALLATRSEREYRAVVKRTEWAGVAL